MCSMYMTEDVLFWLQPGNGFQELRTPRMVQSSG